MPASVQGSRAFGAASLGLTSAYDQSMRPGWVASTKLNSPSVLGRESQHLRVSWLLSMGCGPKDYLPASSHVPSSRSSSKNGASSCGGMMGAGVEGEAAQSIDSSHQAATRRAGTPSQSNRPPQPETPAFETPADNAQAATPGQMPLSEKLVMSLSEPSGTPGPSTPAASEASHQVHKRRPAAQTSGAGQQAAHGAPCHEATSSALQGEQECGDEEPLAAAADRSVAARISASGGIPRPPRVSSSSSSRAGAGSMTLQRDAVSRLMHLIEAPPSIDLVPLRTKFARDQSGGGWEVCCK